MRTLRDERGITGLETAIILIAFVVVASVFAYTVLTAGIYSSERSAEAIHAGLDEARSSLMLRGTTIAYASQVDLDGSTATPETAEAVVRVSLTLGLALEGVAIDLSPPYRVNAASGYLEGTGLENTLVVTYLDQRQLVRSAAWSVAFIGANDDDYALEGTEKAVLTVWLADLRLKSPGVLWYTVGAGDADPFVDGAAALLGPSALFAIELSPAQGAPVLLEKLSPADLEPVMSVH